MPLLTFAVLGLMLLGAVLGNSKPAPSQVPVAVDSCDLIQGLQIGDRVRLAVDTQGIVYAPESTGAPLTSAPDRSLSANRPPAPCQATTAT